MFREQCPNIMFSHAVVLKQLTSLLFLILEHCSALKTPTEASPVYWQISVNHDHEESSCPSSSWSSSSSPVFLLAWQTSHPDQCLLSSLSSSWESWLLMMTVSDSKHRKQSWLLLSPALVSPNYSPLLPGPESMHGSLPSQLHNKYWFLLKQ